MADKDGAGPPACWLDANVLLRLVTGEPAEMADAAAALASRAERGELRLRLSVLVVAEMTWVLRSYYGFAPGEIGSVLSRLAAAEGVETEELDLVLQALDALGRHKVDFVDAYLAAKARTHGQAVCSFDADFGRLDVEVIAPG